MTQLLRLAVVFAVLALAPLVIASEFALNLVVMVLYAALLGQAWNILGGYGGQFSFGHAAFYGTGAYCAAMMTTNGMPFALALAAAALTAAAVGIVVGFARSLCRHPLDTNVMSKSKDKLLMIDHLIVHSFMSVRPSKRLDHP